MSVNERWMSASVDEVWAVLADGWLYPVWVVGATRMRAVDPEWPAVGARLDHSVGVWPLTVNDTTEVERCVPGQLLGLRARAWPSGEAGVELRLEPSGSGALVRIEEDAVRGPGRLVPPLVRHLPMKWRNVETLRRLAFIAEHRGRTRG